MQSILSRWSGAEKIPGVWVSFVAVSLAVAAAVPAIALAHGNTKVVGSPRAGKGYFVSTCGVCHTLRAAGTAGKVGPNLDKVPLLEATIIKAITNGGATVMSKAAAAKYTTQMLAYKGALTTEQITNIAAYVYVSTHRPVASTTTTTATTTTTTSG
jgi:mono/diheme cytochrome c family protein